MAQYGPCHLLICAQGVGECRPIRGERFLKWVFECRTNGGGGGRRRYAFERKVWEEYKATIE